MQDLLRGLNPRHCPLYPLKMLRLLRVIVYVLNNEIALIFMEAYLLYHSGFVCSTSDFWWHPTKKLSFGACIASVMAKRYRFRNGLSLFCSDTTYASIKENTEILLSSDPVPTTGKCKLLLDFVGFDKKKDGSNVGEWLTDIHNAVKCKPSYVGSHVVDGAGDAGASVKEMKITMAGETPREMISATCDSHQANSTGGRCSGTSSHKTNLNPNLGVALKKLHACTGRIVRSGTRKKVMSNVREEKGRTKYPRITTIVTTRWNAEHLETESAAANQVDLSVAIKQMVSPEGEDKDLYREHRANLDAVIPTNLD